jgi:aryl-alcohol dehydrogenase-like predicted oxidoreductase
MESLPTRSLGRNGLDVSVVCLGTWPLGGGMGALEENQAIKTVHAAIDAGTNFIDTAEGYYTSESVLGKALLGRRDRVMIATKLSGEHSPQHIRVAIESSLLSGKYKASHSFSENDDRAGHPTLTQAVREAAVEINRRLMPWAQDHGYTMAQLAIAWTLGNAAVTTAICGAKTPQQAIENSEAGRWQLSVNDMAEIAQQIEGLSPGV